MSLFNELKRRNVFRVGIAYTVASWLLIQVTDIVFPRIGLPDSAVMLVIALLAIGLVPALILAWAFELTPDGIKKEAEVDRTQSIASTTGRKLDRAIIGILVVALAYFIFDKFSSQPTVTATPGATVPTETSAFETGEQGSTRIQSVAVLPFVNMSSDPEQEYFSDGISEEILNVLTRIPNLKVAARTSSFQFKGKNLDIADIGKQLQVNHLLEGSVRKSGNTLRITAQLIETETGFHLWSETYDRNPEDVFAIQDEIAAAIAVELRTILSSEVDTSSKPIDMQAYELYLKGRGLVARRQPGNILQGITILKQALTIEPEYAPALAALAQAYVVLPFFSNELPVRQARELAKNLAQKSLEIDPQNVVALSALAIVYDELDINPTGAIELLQRAIQLNPGSIVANNFLGDLYLRSGDLEQALIYESRAAELDPLAPLHLSDLAAIYLLTGEYDKVMSFTNRALALDSRYPHALQYQGYVYYFLGDAEQLDRIFEIYSALPDNPIDRVESLRICLLLAQGNLEQAENILKQNIQLAKTGKMSAFYVAINAIDMGKFDIAGELLLQAYREKDGRWISPFFIRLPEQAPDSEPWQDFWSQPGLPELAKLRRSNGLKPHAPTLGSGAKQ